MPELATGISADVIIIIIKDIYTAQIRKATNSTWLKKNLIISPNPVAPIITKQEDSSSHFVGPQGCKYNMNVYSFLHL